MHGHLSWQKYKVQCVICRSLFVLATLNRDLSLHTPEQKGMALLILMDIIILLLCTIS